MTESRKQRVGLATAWREARRLVWERKGRLAAGFLLLLLGRLAGLVLPASSKLLIDDILVNGRGELLLPVAAAILAATLVQASTSLALTQVLEVAAQRAITETKRRLQRHVLRLPVSYYDATRTGELVSRVMSDAEGLRNLLGSGLVHMVGSLITATAAFAILLYLNWRLTLLEALILVGFGSTLVFGFRRLRPLFRERWQVMSQVVARLTESLGGVREVKAYTAEKHEELQFTRGMHRLLRLAARTLVGISAVSAFSGLVVGSVGALLFVVGGRAILAGTMTLGDLVMFVFFTGLFAAPLMQAASIATQLSEAFAGLDRIRDVLELETEDAADRDRQVPPVLRGDVAMRGVDFSYRDGVPVLQAIDLEAAAGTTTALVGASGAGKSTLVRLILAFDPPQAGQIFVDGLDLAGLQRRPYRRQVGVVLQDTFLFDGTIAENIGYARPQATRAEIEQVGRVAHCEEFVADLVDGYDTVIGERGVKLSGGQRQRVAIARAILADPRILILDEATSSLDSESELLIQDALRRLRAGRTTFVIAHRLSTVVSADQILVLDRGRIVERGRHAALMTADGPYRRFYDQQHRTATGRFDDSTAGAPEARPPAPAGPRGSA